MSQFLHSPTHAISTEWSSSSPQMGHPPLYARARRLLPDKLQLAKDEFRKMEELGIIHRSISQCSSPLHMVPKPSGGWRPCGNFRRPNAFTTSDRYPVPHIQDFTANLVGERIFSKIDLVRGYHQIPVHTDDIPKTADRSMRVPTHTFWPQERGTNVLDTVLRGQPI